MLWCKNKNIQISLHTIHVCASMAPKSRLANKTKVKFMMMTKNRGTDVSQKDHSNDTLISHHYKPIYPSCKHLQISEIHDDDQEQRHRRVTERPFQLYLISHNAYLSCKQLQISEIHDDDQEQRHRRVTERPFQLCLDKPSL